LINNTSKFFILIYGRDSCILWFLNELNLTYQRLTNFMASFDFIPIVLVSWDRFLLCHAPIKPLLAFQDQISILIVSCITMWFRGCNSINEHSFVHGSILAHFHANKETNIYKCMKTNFFCSKFLRTLWTYWTQVIYFELISHMNVVCRH
jgi:hypothetical protein